jgi:anti-sigma factor RsiW
VNCVDTPKLIHGYLDDELDAAPALEVRAHLQTCAACAAVYAELQALSEAIRDQRDKVPDLGPLRARVESQWQAAGAAAAQVRTPLPWRRVAATLAVAVAVTWGLTFAFTRRDVEKSLTDAAVAGYMRSAMVKELGGVTASDARSVEAWLRARVDFSPAVKDLTAQGFALVGARLDYLYDSRAAAVLYSRGKHGVTVFSWRATEQETFPTRLLSDSGLHIRFWTSNSTHFCVVSDLGASEFELFLRGYR